MEIDDIEVFRTMQKVAKMEPFFEKFVSLVNNGGLDKRIREAVSRGITECPFYIENNARKKILGFVKWSAVIVVPIVTTLITIKFTVGF